MVAPPTLIGLERAAFTDLSAVVEQHLLDHPSAHTASSPATAPCGAPPVLSDRLPATVVRYRWKAQIRVLTALLSSPASAHLPRDHPLLEALDGRGRPTPITAPTARDLANLMGSVTRSTPKTCPQHPDRCVELLDPQTPCRDIEERHQYDPTTE
ncbi:hypothetical protein P3T26_005864 [Streptomyces sp. MAA16]|nr:hypothetical protein [Streptomyces sp. MAA16]